MSTPAQALASRINGAKSTGPVTAEGRERSSRNSTTHGLSSSQTVLPGESQQDFDKLLAAFVARYHPKTEIEVELVNEIASARWRMRRAARLETLLLNEEIAKLQNEPKSPAAGQVSDTSVSPEPESCVEGDAAMAMAFMNLTAKGGSLTQLHRHEARLRRSYEKAVKELEELQALRAQEEEIQNEPEGEPELITAGLPAPRLAIPPQYAGVLDRMLQRPSGRKVLEAA